MPKAKNGYKTLLNPLWTRNITLSKSGGNYEAGTHVCRIRRADYEFHVFISEAGGDAQLRKAGQGDVAGTGIPRFDEKPLAEASGGTPSWEMLSMAYEVSTVGHDNQAFAGVVAVDQAGWVVWLCVASRVPRAPARALFSRAWIRGCIVRYFLDDTAGNYRVASAYQGTPAVWDFLREQRGDGGAVLLEVEYERTGRRTTASTGARTPRSTRSTRSASSRTSTATRLIIAG